MKIFSQKDEMDWESKLTYNYTTFGKLKAGDKFYWGACEQTNGMDAYNNRVKCRKLKMHRNMSVFYDKDMHRSDVKIKNDMLWTPLKGPDSGVIFCGDGFQLAAVVRFIK